MPTQNDDFQCAAANAQAKAGAYWFEMSVREQARSIYDQMRQIDAVRALAMNAESGRRKMASKAWAA